MSVYNIIWADDEIDDFLDDAYREDLLELGFKVVEVAHNGEELERVLKKNQAITDAVIVDANFSESKSNVASEREVSGLDYARNLYRHVINYTIPFFLYSGRTEELLRDVQSKERPNLLKDFKRHENWFSKTLGERDELLDAIKKEIIKRNSTSFRIRNRYKYELNAASLFDDCYDFILDFLVRDYDNTLEEIREPFASVRRYIEKIFGQCETMNIIPPVSDNTNGVANYFLHNKFSVKEAPGKYKTLYEMLGGNIMPKPLAQSLSYIVDITQDGAHSKNELKLKVDEYFKETKDTLMLRSVVFILMDVMKWFATIALSHQDYEKNKQELWREVD